jgi:hypothetical protein
MNLLSQLTPQSGATPWRPALRLSDPAESEWRGLLMTYGGQQNPLWRQASKER